MAEERSAASGRLPAAKAVPLAELVEYAVGSIVSRALAQTKAGSITLFAFDAGQGLSEHAAPYDAHVIVLDGTARLTIGGEPLTAKVGEIVLMPAGIPHAVEADGRMKMLLVMIRG